MRGAKARCNFRQVEPLVTRYLYYQRDIATFNETLTFK